MYIDKDNWFSRLFFLQLRITGNTWLINDYKIGWKQTDLCSMFRRVFIYLPCTIAFFLVVAGIGLFGIGGFIYLLFTNAEVRKTILIAVAVIAALLGVVALIAYIRDLMYRARWSNEPPGIFRQYYKAFKEKYCPQVSFVKPEITKPKVIEPIIPSEQNKEKETE